MEGPPVTIALPGVKPEDIRFDHQRLRVGHTSERGRPGSGDRKRIAMLALLSPRGAQGVTGELVGIWSFLCWRRDRLALRRSKQTR
jgi:hypothetical protein